jgi:integrase
MQGMSWNYVDRSTVAIKECFRKAVENDLIIKNPTMGLIKPKATKGTRRALTEDEISLFKKVAEKHIHGDIFAIMLACGLRPGEARALTWFNVDLKNKLLFVQQAVENHSNNIKEPKTSAGIRTVPIPDWYMPYLTNKKKSQSIFVFPNTLGNVLDATAIRRAWDSFRRQMDLEAGAETYRNKIIIHKIDQNISPYYLRHTFATKCIEKGVDPRTLQHLMGHENISTTMKYYTHVTPKMLDDAREKINVV